MKEKIIFELQKKLKEFGINDEIEIELTTPKQNTNGDYSTNLAMKLTKIMQSNPLEIAEKIVNNLVIDSVSKIEIKNPGFINFFIEDDYIYQNIDNIIKLDQDYGKSNIGQGKKYNIEFVSANPTGILHIGNARGGAYGDSLSRILKFAGYDVTKEYYINDAGTQIDNLGLSIQAKYKNLCNIAAEIPENGYHGPEILEMASKLYEEHQDSLLTSSIEYFKEYGTKELLSKIINDLKEYGIEYDVFTSEKDIYQKYPPKEIVEEMTKNGYTYEKDEAIWFKSTKFNDDKDHVLIRNDGNFTYLVPDIGNHINKYKRNFDKMIDVFGTDHHGYVARLKGAIEASGYDSNKLEVKLLQLVRLIRGNEIVKMSKRTGNTVTLKDLTEEVGVNAARYFFAMHSLDTQMDFDLELATKKSNENPVYYVSYAYARICSILNSYQTTIKEVDYNLIKNTDSRALLNIVAKFPEVVENAAIKELPHLVTNYVYELANAFHAYYSNNRLITDNDSVTMANMNMIKAIKITIKNALNLIGVEPPEKM